RRPTGTAVGTPAGDLSRRCRDSARRPSRRARSGALRRHARRLRGRRSRLRRPRRALPALALGGGGRLRRRGSGADRNASAGAPGASPGRAFAAVGGLTRLLCPLGPDDAGTARRPRPRATAYLGCVAGPVPALTRRLAPDPTVASRVQGMALGLSGIG